MLLILLVCNPALLIHKLEFSLLVTWDNLEAPNLNFIARQIGVLWLQPYKMGQLFTLLFLVTYRRDTQLKQGAPLTQIFRSWFYFGRMDLGWRHGDLEDSPFGHIKKIQVYVSRQVVIFVVKYQPLELSTTLFIDLFHLFLNYMLQQVFLLLE